MKKRNKKIQSNLTFKPKTNCSLEFNGQRYNLHTLSQEQVEHLLVNLHGLSKSAEELKIDYKFSGYSVNDWLEDLQNKLTNLNIKLEQSKLDAMQKKLDGLLSADAQVAKQLSEIAELLK